MLPGERREDPRRAHARLAAREVSVVITAAGGCSFLSLEHARELHAELGAAIAAGERREQEEAGR